ncbi:PhzF family phenazine biosynthesis protein [Colwellia sp. RSH04]|uniref:PhzF family phenazine biosynthesis protein n=1 Tax=Colwellia sp. RSH04 TaxID=2305464 RepID=UPI000E571497|nr:PhzF family phenazine biosynthesis protein [Colwellia sp. RSH04]RHW74683.1 PhzF family phenazine biosynthesis protein [Colwellia sp. RSH04]
MEIDIYQVDAFANNTFEGNPAAVCPLKEWVSDELLQKIAAENNLSETAFFVTKGDSFTLRWFTPEAEVDLCGHATLAAAHVLFQHLGYDKSAILFETKSGTLTVEKSEYGYSMSFPASIAEPVKPPAMLTKALGVKPVKTFAAFDYIVVLENEAQINMLSPDFAMLENLDLRGVVVTAPSKDVDFVSRCFFPKLKVNEDPVTGSAHCELAPYWSEKLNRNKLVGKQLSQRTGLVHCEVNGSRVILSGDVVDYMSGIITLNL